MLRAGTRRWSPIQDVKKRARIKRGVYQCEGCGAIGPASIRIDGKRVDNAVVDHIDPITDPNKGFTTWDDLIERMFCETDNLQLLCHKCHTEKTNEERSQAKARRAREKE